MRLGGIVIARCLRGVRFRIVCIHWSIEAGEPVQLGPLDIRRSLVAGRHRETIITSSRSHARSRNGPAGPARSYRPTREDGPFKYLKSRLKNLPPSLQTRRAKKWAHMLRMPAADYHRHFRANFCTAVSSFGKHRTSGHSILNGPPAMPCHILAA